MKEPKSMSVITIPLKTEKWQEDVIEKRLELCRKIYNSMLRHRLRLYDLMTKKEEWINATNVINEVYKAEDKTKRKSKEFKEAAEIKKRLLSDYGFSEYGFTGEVLKFRAPYSQNIPSAAAAISIAKPMWTSFEKMLYGNGKRVHFRRFGDISTIATNGKSGLRLVDKEGKTVLHPESVDHLYCSFGIKGEKTIVMPLLIDHKDKYLLEMLDRDIKVVRIKREQIHKKNRYYIQLTVTGAPAIKYREDTGEIIHPINDGKVGIYIDTKYCTVATEEGTIQYDLSEGIILREEERAEVQQYLDNSRRISNPENYNDDGTIKKGIMEEGRRTKLKWTFSNKYKDAKKTLSDLYRRESEGRKIKRNEIANMILTMGNEIAVNDYPFQAAAMRKKFPEGEDKTESGRNKKKKKAGRTIGENAPATLVMVLDQKLKAAGYAGVTKVKIQNIDYQTEGYRQYYAKHLLDEIA